MKKELTSEIILTEPEDSKTGSGNVEFALADSASEVASFDKSTSGSEADISDLFPGAVLQSPTLTSSSQTPLIRPKMGPKSRISGTPKKSQTLNRLKMGPKSRISGTLKNPQTPPIRPKMGPKSRRGPKIKLDTDTVENMEVDSDVSTVQSRFSDITFSDYYFYKALFSI